MERWLTRDLTWPCEFIRVGFYGPAHHVHMMAHIAGAGVRQVRRGDLAMRPDVDHPKPASRIGRRPLEVHPQGVGSDLPVPKAGERAGASRVWEGVPFWSLLVPLGFVGEPSCPANEVLAVQCLAFGRQFAASGPSPPSASATLQTARSFAGSGVA